MKHEAGECVEMEGGGLQPAPSGEGGAGGLPGSPMGCGSFSRAGCEGKLRQWGGGGPEGSRGVGRGTGPDGRLALLRVSAAVFPPPTRHDWRLCRGWLGLGLWIG